MENKTYLIWAIFLIAIGLVVYFAPRERTKDYCVTRVIEILRVEGWMDENGIVDSDKFDAYLADCLGEK